MVRQDNLNAHRGATSGSMRRMTSGLRTFVAVAVVGLGLSLGAGGCDSGGADKFVGMWTYTGVINPNCLGTPVDPIDLTGETVTIMSTDSSHVSVALGTLCTVTFNVDGSTATAGAGQTCSFDIPGIGPATVMISRWTLTLSGDTITSDFASAVLICTPSGTGTLTRQSDAGAGS
jgi:hypothetical protein